MTRSERQASSVQKWVDNHLKGTLVLPTGFGKTRTGIMAASRFQKGNPKCSILIVVPSDPIKTQWLEELASNKVKASVITMYAAVRHNYSCDLLIIDEIHKAAANTLIGLFQNIKYKVILGLTATFERTDKRDFLIAQYAPPIDTVTLQEAVKNGWLSKFVEYKVMLDVPDISYYDSINRDFLDHFSFFGYDFKLAMSCATDYKARLNEAIRRVGKDQDWHDMNKQLLIHAVGFSKGLQARKKFIYHHQKKIEIATLILQHRLDKKCITFSQTIEMAEQLAKQSGIGKVYSAKDTGKKGRQTLEDFKQQNAGTLHSIMKLSTGFNDPKIAVGITLGFNSSTTTSKQRLGRIIRVNNPDEVKESFTLVLRGTQDEKWAQNSLSGRDFIVIDEQGLRNLLEGKEYTPKIDRPSHITFTA